MADEDRPVDPVAAAEQQWLALRAAHGDRDSQTLDALLTLSSARMAAGDTDAAIDEVTSVLEGRREILGENHPTP